MDPMGAMEAMETDDHATNTKITKLSVDDVWEKDVLYIEEIKLAETFKLTTSSILQIAKWETFAQTAYGGGIGGGGVF